MAGYQDFANTIQTGANAQTPTSPLGSFPELANLYQSSFQLPVSNVGASGIQALGAISDANASTYAKQRSQDIAAEIKKLQDSVDPSKFQQVQKADGGYDFFDPSGKKIDINVFSKVTGKDPASILKNSNNALDQQYLNDFNNLQGLMNTVLTHKSTDDIQTFVDKTFNPNEGKKIMDWYNANKNNPNAAQELVSNFTQFYNNIYTDLPYNPATIQHEAGGYAGLPQIQPGGPDTRSNFQKFRDLLRGR